MPDGSYLVPLAIAVLFTVIISRGDYHWGPLQRMNECMDENLRTIRHTDTGACARDRFTHFLSVLTVPTAKAFTANWKLKAVSVGVVLNAQDLPLKAPSL